jgi:hypothetical protein
MILQVKLFIFCIPDAVAGSLECEANRLKYTAAQLIMQLMDQACVSKDKSDLLYCYGTFVTIISYQGELKSPPGR